MKSYPKEINIVTLCDFCKEKISHFSVIRDVDNFDTINLFITPDHKCKHKTNIKKKKAKK